MIFVSVPITTREEKPLECVECGMWEIESFNFCAMCPTKLKWIEALKPEAGHGSD